MNSRKKIRIAVMAVNNIEDIEISVPVDIWKRAGFLLDIIVCEQRNGFSLAHSGLKVNANHNLKEINFNLYDAIFLPGGSGCKRFLAPPANSKELNESKLHDAIKRFSSEKDKWLIGICSSPIIYFSIIGDSNAKFKRSKFTAFPHDSDLEICKETWVDERVVVDNNLITAKAAGCAFELAFTVVEKLGSLALANKIAAQIFYPWDVIKKFKFSR